MEEKQECFFKNILLNIKKDNSLKILKYNKIQEISKNYFDEKILNIAKNNFELFINFFTNCLVKFCYTDIKDEQIIAFKISELRKIINLNLNLKLKNTNTLFIKKWRKKIYYIKKNYGN